MTLEVQQHASRPIAKLTPFVFFTCLVAGSGGLMYGYDLVVAGGISVMDDFLTKFYPSVLRSEKSAKTDNYCKYNNQVFQLYSSSLYLAALLATFGASIVTRKLGHKATMLVAGILFMIGTALGAGAEHLAMLIFGRIFLGCGLGFSNHAVPLYLSEIAPPSFRGGLNLLFSVNVAVGIFSGNLVNYLASNVHPSGWRISLAVAGIPALLLTLASLVLVDTPSHLIRKGDYEQAKSVLRKVRGSDNVQAEFDDIVKASDAVPQVSKPFKLLLKKRYRPAVVVSMALPFFQQVSGNDAILFYGPFLFKAAGFQSQAALYSTVITGSVALGSTIISVFLVDKAGRRTILLVSSVIMLACMVGIATLFGVDLTPNTQALSKRAGAAEVALVCVFVGAYKASWGPLAWLIPSEILPQEIRAPGQSMVVCVNMLFKFIIAQTFLSMLCAFKYGIFLFFSGWLLIMGLFTLFLIPETKSIALDRMVSVWQKHWFWSSCVEDVKSLEPTKTFEQPL